MDRPTRPGTVTLMAVVFLIGGVGVLGMSGWALFSPEGVPETLPFWIAEALVSIAAGVGLWRLKAWGAVLTGILFALLGAEHLYRYAVGEGVNMVLIGAGFAAVGLVGGIGLYRAMTGRSAGAAPTPPAKK